MFISVQWNIQIYHHLFSPYTCVSTCLCFQCQNILDCDKETLSKESVCVKRHKKLTSFNPFGIQFQHRRILHQHHHHLAFSWAQSFLARATATNYLLPESDAIWCEHISCKFNFYSRKGEQACLVPLHKPGNTWAKKWWRKKRKMLYTVQMKMSNHYTPATSTQV